MGEEGEHRKRKICGRKQGDNREDAAPWQDTKSDRGAEG